MTAPPTERPRPAASPAAGRGTGRTTDGSPDRPAYGSVDRPVPWETPPGYRSVVLRTVSWLIRAGAYVLIGAEAFAGASLGPVALPVTATVYAVCGVLLAGWALLERRPAVTMVGPVDRTLLLTVVLGLIAGLSSAVAVQPGANGMVTLAAIALIDGGAEPRLTVGWAVLGAGVLGAEIGAMVTDASATVALTFPLLMVAGLLMGLNRRSYRMQARQSEVLLAQAEELRAEQRRSAVLDERTRIAREIHDVLAHSLGALGIQIQAARALLTDHQDTDRAVDVLGVAQRMASDGLVETRRAVHALRTDTPPLAEELTKMAAAHEQRHGSTVTLTVAGGVLPLPPDQTLALVRTAHESLTNAAKHAPHRPVTVDLLYGDEDVTLTLTNPLGRTDGREREPGEQELGEQARGEGARRPGRLRDGERRLRPDRDARAAAAARRHAGRRRGRRALDGDGTGAVGRARRGAGPAGGRVSTDDRPLRVIVADDQAAVREGLVLMLDLLPGIDVVGSAADGQQALDLVAEHRPDAILLDLHMPVMDGIEATRRLTAEHPEVAIVVLTTYADDRSVLDTLRAGARSYLTKDADRLHIAQTLRSAASGLTVLHPQVQATLLAAAHPAAAPAPGQSAEPPDGLTRRETEILALIARGMTNTEIAEELFLSGNTIKTHINRIFAKTGSRDRAAATRYAQRHGLG